MNGEKLENAKNALFIALGIDIAVTAVVLASRFWMVDVFNGIAAGGPVASPSVVGYIEFWDNFSKSIILTMFGVGWALIHWLNACYTYAEESLKVTGLLHKRWKTWGWIVPFLNLFKPYQVLNEIYKVGAIGGIESNDWKKSSGSGALLTWWIFWLISHMVMMGIAKKIQESSSQEALNLNQIAGILNSQIVLYLISLTVAGIWFLVAGSLTGRLLDGSARTTRQVVPSSVAEAEAKAGAEAEAKAGAEAEAAVPPFFSSPDLIQKMASEIATLPSGRLGGITCLALSVMGLGMLVILNTMTAPDLPNKFYKELGSASGAAFFGYLSYWFYSGKADPRFGIFRLSLSMALVSGLLAASEGVESGLGSWKAVFLIASTVFFGVGAWKANLTARRKNQASRVSRNLRASSGVPIWVPIVVAGIPLIGILAAVGLPAYQDYTKRQSSAVEADPYAEKQAVRDVSANKQPGLFDDVLFPKAGGDAQPNQGTTTDVIAQLNLGMKHDMGKGVPQNYVEAAKWYRLAAAQGNAIAQNKLGTLYYVGKGVTQDYIRAHVWFNLGAASGSADAVKSRDAVAGKMTTQQIAEAQQIARDCQQRKLEGCD